MYTGREEAENLKNDRSQIIRLVFTLFTFVFLDKRPSLWSHIFTASAALEELFISLFFLNKIKKTVDKVEKLGQFFLASLAFSTDTLKTVNIDVWNENVSVRTSQMEITECDK